MITRAPGTESARSSSGRERPPLRAEVRSTTKRADVDGARRLDHPKAPLAEKGRSAGLRAQLLPPEELPRRRASLHRAPDRDADVPQRPVRTMSMC